ncbi:uncharacterized protein MONOS_5597 [Monocercomonoides exilis]|uniref:uncharacterized protein n=1 Tax=Monocercomonoides exilis TaxID=2049356 RepID=UPI0035594000|nr:hypothetical protein MONOS_5597 [Monocercomonoides exilis]|eukprot:MONOS_5597.1-p1 / transcript=MONOS_5597.1 / gene=MONOS_5597 / organism=Monocercomonoides_exilis_PA203 / gene_product=unspecified product / transcript_product=unspecified product / location=Mono_scaffold00165:949-2760(+) / protein_length=604 / sequence_SO=supercontig / SO=protein_coding / is_pseudo=false
MISNVHMTNCFYSNISSIADRNTKKNDIEIKNYTTQLFTVEGCTFTDGVIHPMGNILPDWNQVSTYAFSNTTFSNIHQHQTTELENNRHTSAFYSLDSDQPLQHRNISYSFCTFQKMSAKRGSVLHIESKDKDSHLNTVDISLFSCTIIDCWTEDEGGALFITGRKVISRNASNFNSVSLYIKDSLFQNTMSKNGRGGTIFATGCETISIKSSSFSKCSCGQIEGEKIMFEEAFSKEGGAIFCLDVIKLSISNTAFINNSAMNGGAISIRQSEEIIDETVEYGTNIFECTFTNNTAKDGFADILFDSNMKLLNRSIELIDCIDSTEEGSIELTGFCLDDGCNNKEVHNEWLIRSDISKNSKSKSNSPTSNSFLLKMSREFSFVMNYLFTNTSLLCNSIRSSFLSSLNFIFKFSRSSFLSSTAHFSRSTSSSVPLSSLEAISICCCVAAFIILLICILIAIRKITQLRRMQNDLAQQIQDKEDEEEDKLDRAERRKRRKVKMEKLLAEREKSRQEAEQRQKELEEEEMNEADVFGENEIAYKFASVTLGMKVPDYFDQTDLDLPEVIQKLMSPHKGKEEQLGQQKAPPQTISQEYETDASKKQL